MPTWFITGCSTGLGRALATEVLSRGWNAVVTARSAATIQDLADAHPDTTLPLALDVSDRTQVFEAVTKAIERFGSIDVLVNNAGHGYRAAIEEAADADLAELFATNLFGPVALIQQVLPAMRARRSGSIVNVSSIAAYRAAAGSGYYAATKSALESVSDALRREVQSLGITVLIVEPGEFRTDFAGRSLQQAANPIADYADTAGLRRKENDHTDGTQPGDPARAPQAVIAALQSDSPPLRLLLGTDAIAFVRDDLDLRRTEVDTWQEVSSSTDYRP